jgi:hypothetical protein
LQAIKLQGGNDPLQEWRRHLGLTGAKDAHSAIDHRRRRINRRIALQQTKETLDLRQLLATMGATGQVPLQLVAFLGGETRFHPINQAIKGNMAWTKVHWVSPNE